MWKKTGGNGHHISTTLTNYWRNFPPIEVKCEIVLSIIEAELFHGFVESGAHGIMVL